MSGTGGYPGPQNQQMYQSMPRTMSGGQLSNNMMTHPGIMMPASQQHIITTQGVMVSQPGYPQSMMQTGQPPPQMMQTISSQPHMGQPLPQGMMQPGQMGLSQGIPQGMTQGLPPGAMPQSAHISVTSAQSQQQMPTSTAMQITSQQAFMQQPSQPSSQQMYTPGGQPRSPSLSGGGPLSQQLTPGGPPSTGGPSSNNPQTPMNPLSMNPSSQQAVATPATPQQAPSSVQSTAATETLPIGPTVVPPDPISQAKNLILKDLRHALMDLNKAASEYLRPSALRQQLDTSSSASSTTHNPLSVNPQSVNPQSVNPQSVNPQSVNPLSVNPSSVKSTDEPKSVESPEKKVQLSPRDTYFNAMNNFLAICDLIEMNLTTIQEGQKQCARFDKMIASELKMVGEMANVNYAQYAQGYIEFTGRLRNSIDRTLNNLNTQVEKIRTAEAKSKGFVKDELMDTADSEGDGRNSRVGGLY